MRLSIYLLKENHDIEDYIKEDKNLLKLDLSKEFNNGEGILVYEETKNELDWIEKINTSNILNDRKLDTYKKTKRGSLIVKMNSIESSVFFVLSFNGGIHLIKNHLIDYNFGYEVASNMIQASKVKKYGSTDIHHQVIRTDKNSSSYIPEHLIGDNLILSSIESISGYSDNEQYFQGNKGLILNFNGDFNEDLIELLEYLYAKYKLGNEKDSFAKIKKVKNINEINNLDMISIKKILNLKNEFLKNERELKKSNLRDVDLSMIFTNEIDGYKYTGLNRTTKTYQHIDKVEYFEQLSNYIIKNEGTIDKYKLLEKIKRDKIIGVKEVASGYEEVCESTIYNSLFFTIDKEENSEEKAVLIEGNWYYVDKDYYSKLSNRLQSKVIEPDDSISDKFDFIEYNSTHKDELEYNRALADVNRGVLLDERWYYISKEISNRKYSGYSKIEPCDVLLYDDDENKYYFLHTKINSNTQGISHLSTQANISSNLLIDKEISDNFFEAINEIIRENTSTNVPQILDLNNNFTVILSIIDKDYEKKLKTSFTILKLQALDNSISRLEQLGINVKIKMIKDSSK